MAIPLGPVSPRASRDLPGRPARKQASPYRLGHGRRRPYLVLLPVGFAVPPLLPPARCALTAPFHPYPQPAEAGPGGRSALCGTFPGVAPAGRYPAPCFRGARTFLPRSRRERPSGRLHRALRSGAAAAAQAGHRHQIAHCCRVKGAVAARRAIVPLERTQCGLQCHALGFAGITNSAKRCYGQHRIGRSWLGAHRPAAGPAAASRGQSKSSPGSTLRPGADVAVP